MKENVDMANPVGPVGPCGPTGPDTNVFEQEVLHALRHAKFLLSRSLSFIC